MKAKKIPVLSGGQILLLVVGSALMLPYTFLSLLKQAPHSHDVWLSIVLSLPYFIVLDAPLILMMRRFRGLSLEEIYRIIVGSVATKIICCFYIFLFFMSFCHYLVMLVRFVCVELLPGTPIGVILVLTLIPVCYAALKGAGVLGRVATLFVPFIFFSIIIFAVFGIENYETLNIMPIMGDTTFGQLNFGAFLFASQSLEIMMLFMFSRFLKQKTSVTRVFFWAVPLLLIPVLLILLPTLLTLGYKYASLMMNPYYTFTRQVSFYQGMERLQAINAIIIYPGIVLRLSAYCYMGSSLLSNVIPKVEEKKFTILFCVLAFGTALLFFKIGAELADRLGDAYSYAALIMKTGVPLIGLIIYAFRRKEVDKKRDDILAARHGREAEEACLKKEAMDAANPEAGKAENTA